MKNYAHAVVNIIHTMASFSLATVLKMVSQNLRHNVKRVILKTTAKELSHEETAK